MALTRDQIIKFLTERAVNPCPMCGTNNWNFPDRELDYTVGLFNPRADKGYVMPGAITPAVILICNHCAFMRLHSPLFIAHILGIKTDG